MPGILDEGCFYYSKKFFKGVAMLQQNQESILYANSIYFSIHCYGLGPMRSDILGRQVYLYA